jgi:Ca-activated chloride channel family protein
VNEPVYDTLSVAEYKQNHIVLLLDVSNSMADNNKIILLKTSVSHLIKSLRTIDRVTIITYANQVNVLYDQPFITDKKGLLQLIDSIQPAGGTSADKGLDKAYALARERYMVGGNNDLFLATDGEFEVSKEQKKEIKTNAQSKDRPIRLNILGFGSALGYLKELESLAATGSGEFLGVSNMTEAQILLPTQVRINSKKK